MGDRWLSKRGEAMESNDPNLAARSEMMVGDSGMIQSNWLVVTTIPIAIGLNEGNLSFLCVQRAVARG